MILQRQIGVTLRNKGLKKGDQMRDTRKFFKFWWEQIKKVVIPTKTEWKALDRKYIRKK